MMSWKEDQSKAEINSPDMEKNNTEDGPSGVTSTMESVPLDPENSVEMCHSPKMMADSLAIAKDVGSRSSERLFDQNLEKVKPPLINTHPGMYIVYKNSKCYFLVKCIHQ